MNFIAVMYNAFIMKILWMLSVVLHLYLMQVFAKPVRTSLCTNYCNLLYSGWHMSFTNDCFCSPQENNIEKNFISQSISQPILHSTKFNNRERSRIFGDSFGFEKGELNYNDLFQRLINIYLDVDGAKLNRKLKNGKIKRTSSWEQNSNDSDNFDNNFKLNADNLSVCIDLHILLEKQNKIKNNLPSSDIKDLEYLEIDEIHREIAKNCDQTRTIIRNSISEIKGTFKPKRVKNKLDDNKEPQTERTIVSHHTTNDYKNPTIAVDSTYKDINNSNFITTTEYLELIKDNLKELNLSDEDRIQKISTEGSPSLSNNFLATGKEESQTVNFKNISTLNNKAQRQNYNESRAYVIKLITQELSNGTVLSFINGTEILSKTDNEDIVLQTEVPPKNKVAASTSYGFLEQNLLNVPLTSITRRLYIMYEEKRIP